MGEPALSANVRAYLQRHKDSVMTSALRDFLKHAHEEIHTRPSTDFPFLVTQAEVVLNWLYRRLSNDDKSFKAGITQDATISTEPPYQHQYPPSYPRNSSVPEVADAWESSTKFHLVPSQMNYVFT